MKQIASFLFRAIIILYQKTLSPLLPPSCRYTPTCSEYALGVIKKHGPFEGGKLTVKRILKCHPWGGEGHDPIP